MKERTCIARINEPGQLTLAEGFVALLKLLNSEAPERCGKPAMFESPLGDYCEACAEKLRERMRNPNMALNVLAGGGARTEEQIAKLVRPINTVGAERQDG